MYFFETIFFISSELYLLYYLKIIENVLEERVRLRVEGVEGGRYTPGAAYIIRSRNFLVLSSILGDKVVMVYDYADDDNYEVADSVMLIPIMFQMTESNVQLGGRYLIH